MAKEIESLFGADHGLDPKSAKALTQALTKSNLPGFDYLEFRQALQKLIEMDMDEATAYKSAFATASTMGLTKAKLQQSAKHYHDVLDKEKKAFDNALKKQVQQKIEGKRAEVEKMKGLIEKYQAKIRELQEQIASYQKTISEADSVIQKDKEKIEERRDSFEHALTSMKNQIRMDVENMEKYL